jgi:hypothetical protein
MNRVRFVRWMGSLGMVGALALAACGGESETTGDDGSGGEAGDPSGNGGSAGTGAQGGSGGTAGAPTGGTGGTVIPPDGMCEDITACGGDPEGSWQVRENCAEVLVPGVVDMPGCEDIVGRGSAEVTGTFTFSSGVVIQNTVITAYVWVVVTDACAQAIVGSDMITAADLCPLLDAQLMMDPATPLNCAVAAEGCLCEGEQPPQTNMGTDTYLVMGNQLLFGGDAFDFCQDGDELHLHGTTVDAGTGADVALTLLLDRI